MLSLHGIELDIDQDTVTKKTEKLGFFLGNRLKKTLEQSVGSP